MKAITAKEYLDGLQTTYIKEISNLKLFSRTWEFNWLDKQTFTTEFYQIRAHLSEYIWLLGSIAPSVEYKEVLLQNFAQELGDEGNSRETLYISFCNSIIATIRSEDTYSNLATLYAKSANEKFGYGTIARAFHTSHHDFQHSSSSWASKWAVFCTLKYIDPIDNDLILKTLKNKLKGETNTDFTYFEKTSKLESFATTQNLLEKLWLEDREEVKKGIHFSLNTQIAMWTQFSDCVN